MELKDKKFLNALALGDGFIRKTGNSYAICISHCKDQKALIEYKANELSRILGRAIKVHPFNNSGYDAYRLEVAIPYLKFVHKWLYKPNKTISLSFLRRLSNKGIAIWYMDDGSLYAKKRNSKIHAYELVISMYVSKEEAENAIIFMKERFDVNFTKKRNKEKFSIRCGTNEAKKFLSHIKEYIIPSMIYKTFQTGAT